EYVCEICQAGSRLIVREMAFPFCGQRISNGRSCRAGLSQRVSLLARERVAPCWLGCRRGRHLAGDSVLGSATQHDRCIYSRKPLLRCPRGSIHGARSSGRSRGRARLIRGVVRTAGGDRTGYLVVKASARIGSRSAGPVCLVLGRRALFATPERALGKLADVFFGKSGFSVSSIAVAGESMTFSSPIASRNSLRRVW